MMKRFIDNKNMLILSVCNTCLFYSKAFVEKIVNTDQQPQFWIGGYRRPDRAWVWINTNRYIDQSVNL